MHLLTLALLITPVYADSTQEGSYQQLGLKNSEILTISDPDDAAIEKQAVEGFDANVERSDPNARSAIRNTMKDRNMAAPSTQAGDLSSALTRARALPPNPTQRDLSDRSLKPPSGEAETTPAYQN